MDCKKYSHGYVRVVGLVSSFVLIAPALAMWAMPTNVPVGRLIANIKPYTEEHPEDPQGFYVLGRVHGLAFTLKSREVGVWTRRGNDSKLPEIAREDFQFPRFRRRQGSDTEALRLAEDEFPIHMTGAVRNLERAIALDPKPAHYHLGLAYVLEHGIVLAERSEIVPGAESIVLSDDEKTQLESAVESLTSDEKSVRDEALAKLRSDLAKGAVVIHQYRNHDNPDVRETARRILSDHWREQAIKAYYAAYQRAIKDDLAIQSLPMRGIQSLAGYESGLGFAQLMAARGPQNDDERNQLAQVRKDLTKLKNKPRAGGITPIIFALDSPRPLSDLLERDSAVCFDLNGDGQNELWPWVKPNTGILVWDPDNTGQITSGRQLFGSVTWWMFFTDGYHALNALDDNRDGELSGDELSGLAVWFDVNSNGISDPGEVSPIAKLGVAAILTHATMTVGSAPANPIGLIMGDGRALPTYDWIASPVRGNKDGHDL